MSCLTGADTALHHGRQIVTRRIVASLLCLLALSCGGGAGADLPTGPSAQATSRLTIGVDARTGFRVSRSIFQNAQVYSYTYALSVSPWDQPLGNRLTIQRAETTIYGPDSRVYHTYVHQDLQGVQLETLVRPYYSPPLGAETVLVDSDVSRPVGIRYRTVINYTLTASGASYALVAEASGDIVSGFLP